MLSNKEKFVLKKIIKRVKSENNDYDFIDPEELFRLTHSKIEYVELGIILDSLLEKGFINNQTYVKLIDGGRQFTVTQQTLDYNEIAKKALLKFLINSVFIPIIVSAVTSCIVSVINDYFVSIK